ncbi:MAG: four helix bundle protein [Candidatus Saganbacteria bacterium]|nr:four helix bundle protein [Candidatus Saganbacteria bacterium]
MEIQDRTLRFAVQIVKFIKRISKNPSINIINDQLLRSAASIGANMTEADSACSKKDFINKVFIAKKEAQETEYWLKIMKEAELINNADNKKELENITSECREIILILAAIIRKSKS